MKKVTLEAQQPESEYLPLCDYLGHQNRKKGDDIGKQLTTDKNFLYVLY